MTAGRPFARKGSSVRVPRVRMERCCGIAAWSVSERRFTEWVQSVAFWYGQLAFVPP
jgi:hypothetical protein